MVSAERMALAALTLEGMRGTMEEWFVSLPRLSEGLAGAPIAGHSLTDVRLGERDELFRSNGMDHRRFSGLR